MDWPFVTGEELRIFKVPGDVAANLANLDIALGQMGLIAERINVSMVALEKLGLQDLTKLLAPLRRKLEVSWEAYLLLEDIVSTLPKEHRETHFGPFRDPEGSKVPFLESPRGRRFIARTSASFEGFLVHAESLLDTMAKIACQDAFRPTSEFRNTETMSAAINAFRQQPKPRIEPTTSRTLEALSVVASNFDVLDELRSYRNFVVHYGSIPIRSTVVRTPSGYLDTAVTGAQVRKISSKDWEILEDPIGIFGGFDVAKFCRFTLWWVLDMTNKILATLAAGTALPSPDADC